jgi:ABC-type branched-subunit amino acid transport system ATPase component
VGDVEEDEAEQAIEHLEHASKDFIRALEEADKALGDLEKVDNLLIDILEMAIEEENEGLENLIAGLASAGLPARLESIDPDALARINREDGRMVIANLHTLDTARRYCGRVIGMRDGRIVFDGSPEQLTTGAARDIYGADASFSESATSTAIDTLPPDTAYAASMASA